MAIKLTIEQITQRLSELGFMMVNQDEYKNTKSRMAFKCDLGHEWKTQLTHVVNLSSGCPGCLDDSVKKDQISKLEKRGLELVDEYSNTRTVSKFKCCQGHIFTGLMNNVVNKKYDCPTCRESRLTTDIINQRNAHKKITMIDEYKNDREKYRFTCEQNHVWYSRADHVTCVLCDGTKLSKEIVNDRIKHKNVELVGNFINALTKTEFRCMTCSSEWSTSPASVIHQSSCPSCSTKGFNNSKKAHGYVLDFGHFIKFGISTNIKRRLECHRRHNPPHKVIYERSFDSGKDARCWENGVKTTFGSRFVTKDECPDGWTETLNSNKIDELILFSMGY